MEDAEDDGSEEGRGGRGAGKADEGNDEEGRLKAWDDEGR